MSTSWILTLTYVFTGLLFIALGIPLILRKIGPNHFYGFRFPKTMADEKTWYEVNHTGGIDVCIAGAVICLCAVIAKLLLPAAAPHVLVGVNTVVMISSVTSILVHALIVLKRY